LSAIKGCGASAGAAIVEERRANGPFRDLFDFCERLGPAQCNRSSIEALIKAGALDDFGAARSQLIASLDRAMQSGAAALADKKSGQKSLFGFEDDESDEPTAPVSLPSAPPWDQRQTQIFEKEVLGFYLSGHPLSQHRQRLAPFCSHTTDRLRELSDRERVTLGGIVSSVKYAHVKNVRDANSPTKYGMFDLEDVEGTIRCIMWPTEFADQGHLIQSESIVVAQGRIDRNRGDEANLICERLIPIESLDQHLTSGIKIHVDEQIHGTDGLKKTYEIIRGYPGHRPLELNLCLADGTHVQLATHKTKIDINEQLCGRLRDLLGSSNVEMLVDRKALAGKASNGRRDDR
jgi:DNA polymerase-3 subunit alpha